MVGQMVVHERTNSRTGDRLDHLVELEYLRCGNLDRMVPVWTTYLV